MARDSSRDAPCRADDLEPQRESSQFLSELFGDAPGPGANIVVWSGVTHDASWHDQIESAATAVAKANTTGDVYFGVALHDPVASLAEAQRREDVLAEGKKRKPRWLTLRNTRGFSSTAVAIGGAWADIDVVSPWHKKPGLPPDVPSVIAALNRLPLRPSLVLNTGGGAHAWWGFKEVWVFETPDERSRAERIVKGWQRKIAEVTGWTIDPTGDLARVMRLPGTMNWKSEAPR